MNLFALNHTRIPLREVKDGSARFLIRFQDPELLRLNGIEITGEITAEVAVTLVGTDILAELDVCCDAAMCCDRCGDNFHRQIRGAVKTLFSRDKEDCAEFDEVKWLAPTEHEIDLREDIRDALALALPAKVLCSENCKGLCPQCGARLNVETCSCPPKGPDSRWDALKNIIFEEDEE